MGAERPGCIRCPTGHPAFVTPFEQEGPVGLGFFTLEMDEAPSILPAPWTEVPDVRVLVNGTVVSKGTPVDSHSWWPALQPGRGGRSRP